MHLKIKQPVEAKTCSVSIVYKLQSPSDTLSLSFHNSSDAESDAQVMKWSFKFPYFVDGFTRRQEKGGYQGTHSLAIARGHAAQDVVAISAINGRSHYVSLKLNILQGFSPQDAGEPGCMIPESRAAAQAVMGAFASTGCKLAQKLPSSA